MECPTNVTIGRIHISKNSMTGSTKIRLPYTSGKCLSQILWKGVIGKEIQLRFVPVSLNMHIFLTMKNSMPAKPSVWAGLGTCVCLYTLKILSQTIIEK